MYMYEVHVSLCGTSILSKGMQCFFNPSASVLSPSLNAKIHVTGDILENMPYRKEGVLVRVSAQCWSLSSFFGTFLWTFGEVLLSLGVHFIMQAFAFWPRARSNLPVTLIGQAANVYHANLFNIDEISSQPYCCRNATACGQSRRLSFILSAPQICQIFHIFQTHLYSPLSALVHRRFSDISTL